MASTLEAVSFETREVQATSAFWASLLGRKVRFDGTKAEFCVIAPANAFLAACGTLGEVTCEGIPTAGRFWQDALEWTPVRDQDGKYAIQSLEGGTKLSWDGGSPADATGWNRQRFVLAPGDGSAEIDRLTALGATFVCNSADGSLWSDPDGSEFLLLQH